MKCAKGRRSKGWEKKFAVDDVGEKGEITVENCWGLKVK
jgi:hypothetical protein